MSHNDKENHDLVGRCGIYCGACSVYRANIDFPQIKEVYAKACHCPPENVACKGCSGLTESCWGNNCPSVICLNAKGYKYCYECPENEAHSCERFNELEARYHSYGIDLRENMDAIRSGNTDQWLKEQAEHFICSHCGKPVSMHTKHCHHCGK